MTTTQHFDEALRELVKHHFMLPQGDAGQPAADAADAIRALAALPLDMREIAGLEELLSWEQRHGEGIELTIDLDDPAASLAPIVGAGAKMLRARRFEAAAALYREAVRMAIVLLGEEHRDTATYINGLGRVYYQAGDFETAGRSFKRAIDLRFRLMGANHTDTAISMTNQAQVREAEGKYVEAVALHRKALAIVEAAMKPEHPDTGVNLNELGCALQAVGEHVEARQCFERALEISRMFDGENDLNTATVLGNLGGRLNQWGIGTTQGALMRSRSKSSKPIQMYPPTRGDGCSVTWDLCWQLLVKRRVPKRGCEKRWNCRPVRVPANGFQSRAHETISACFCICRAICRALIMNTSKRKISDIGARPGTSHGQDRSIQS